MAPQTKVFIGSLPQGSKPEDLRQLFERFGVVTECDIMNRCGFVHMQTEEQAATAIRALHNSNFNGGVISVERGRIKERGQRGPGGPRGGGGMRGGRGGMDRRGGGGGGPMRGGPPGGGRDAPYMRDRNMGGGGGMRGHMGGGGMARNGGGGGYQSGGYDRGMDSRAPVAQYDDRYNGYGGEDRRGFALSRDPYAAPAPMYDDRRGYAAPVDDMGGMYADDRRAPMYPEESYDRRAPMAISSTYERPVRGAGMGNGDMYSRRSPTQMRAPASGGYERDPYAQSYAPMPRSGAASGARDGGMRCY